MLGRMLVLFGDGNERYPDFADLELAGEGLRRAQTCMEDGSHNKDSNSRVSGGINNVFSFTGPQTGDDAYGDDADDAPLTAVLGCGTTNQGQARG